MRIEEAVDLILELWKGSRSGEKTKLGQNQVYSDAATRLFKNKLLRSYVSVLKGGSESESAGGLSCFFAHDQ